MEAYRLQERRWLEKHESLQRFMYEAVVPIVIYTGERTWQAPTPFRELVKGGDAFAAFIPSSEPLFLSLPGATEEELVRHGGVLGAVLHVLQQRHAALEEFHRLLTKAVGTVEGQVGNDQHRLLELLSYLAALVYHFRSVNERDSLREELERSIQTQTVRKEIHSMGQTIAEALREEGKQEGKEEGKIEGERKGKQETLLLLLRERFGTKVTPALAATVRRTRDLRTLDEWARHILTADTLEDVGIRVGK